MEAPVAAVGIGNLLKWPGGSLSEPSKGTGGRKSVWGRCGWRVRAMATEVVAAAAWRGAWMRGAQITGVCEEGVCAMCGAGGGVCNRWAQ